MSNLKFTFLLLLFAAQAKAQTINITGPAGSGQFGKTVTVLTNGNYVVTDPLYDEGAVADVGAVYLYNGVTHTLISTLKGSTLNDQVGSGGITLLSNGNYILYSPNWDNGVAVDVGAVTWCSNITGVSGVIGNNNSLVGSTNNDNVGNGGIISLSNGNYVVSSLEWDNTAAIDAGAVSWGSGVSGLNGIVSSSNSLVGSTDNDRIGGSGILKLSNSNYLILSPYWDNGAAINAGAVTWGSGIAGVSGAISSSNSLVGSSASDEVGYKGVTILSNGNYLVRSQNWDNGVVVNVGAVTWGNGSTGISGIVSSSNSLVGSTANDQIGLTAVLALSNGNYIVGSKYWDNGIMPDVGAVTWGSGSTGISGIISSSNSLVGSSAYDFIGSDSLSENNWITVLTNGNYVVCSPSWTNGTVSNAGAATLCNGNTGTVGFVGISNSLVGSKLNDQIGYNRVTPLSNGNYVVASQNWDNGSVSNAGAVTWGNGTTGIIGIVSSSNSLVGSKANDNIGYPGVTALLGNGNYLVHSRYWDNGSFTDAGAITWGNGTTGIAGLISSSNSLISIGFVWQIIALSNGNYVVNTELWSPYPVTYYLRITWGNGTTGVWGGSLVAGPYPYPGQGSAPKEAHVTALSNGNYVVNSPNWNNGLVTDAGAVTWVNGTTGISGEISSSNSLVGTKINDRVGGNSYLGVAILNNNNYVVCSPFWNNGAITKAGAVTFGNGNTGTSGIVSSSNSLVGSHYNDFIGSDSLGFWNIIAIGNGNYVVSSPSWTNDTVNNSGAVTICSASSGISGTIGSNNSVMGTTAYGGSLMNSAYNSIYQYLIVGRPADNIVTIFNPSALPLQLLNFYASLTQNDVLLTWKTTNEINMHSFDVERSTDGRIFTKVGIVAAINSAIDQTYNYTDAGAGLLNTSKLYYRLKIIDKNGSYSNSLIVLLHLSKSNSVTVYPNPVSNITTLSFSNKALLNTPVVLVDILGKQVRQFIISNYQEQIDMSRLSDGVYILKLADGTAIKLVKN